MENRTVILVVDDQPDFVEGVKLILEAEGYEVWTAINGQAALDELQTSFKNRRSSNGDGTNKKYLPDLILADIMMPVLDGYGLHEKVSNNPYLNHIPFVFLTAKTEADDIRYGKETGVDDYITKPCQPDDLLATVRGKLKRTSRRRAIAAQIIGNPTSPSAAGIVIVVAVVVLIIVLTALLTLYLSS
jgi:CheY-like chemotaxis protein